MNARADHYRREAGWLEQLAKSISLLSDKEVLLVEAQSLRQRADVVEIQPDGSTEIGPMPVPNDSCD